MIRNHLRNVDVLFGRSRTNRICSLVNASLKMVTLFVFCGSILLAPPSFHSTCGPPLSLAQVKNDEDHGTSKGRACAADTFSTNFNFLLPVSAASMLNSSTAADGMTTQTTGGGRRSPLSPPRSPVPFLDLGAGSDSIAPTDFLPNVISDSASSGWRPEQEREATSSTYFSDEQHPHPAVFLGLQEGVAGTSLPKGTLATSSQHEIENTSRARRSGALTPHNQYTLIDVQHRWPAEPRLLYRNTAPDEQHRDIAKNLDDDKMMSQAYFSGGPTTTRTTQAQCSAAGAGTQGGDQEPEPPMMGDLDDGFRLRTSASLLNHERHEPREYHRFVRGRSGASKSASSSSSGSENGTRRLSAVEPTRKRKRQHERDSYSQHQAEADQDFSQVEQSCSPKLLRLSRPAFPSPYVHQLQLQPPTSSSTAAPSHLPTGAEMFHQRPPSQTGIPLLGLVTTHQQRSQSARTSTPGQVDPRGPRPTTPPHDSEPQCARPSGGLDDVSHSGTNRHHRGDIGSSSSILAQARERLLCKKGDDDDDDVDTSSHGTLSSSISEPVGMGMRRNKKFSDLCGAFRDERQVAELDSQLQFLGLGGRDRSRSRGRWMSGST
ncbi:unnamed protein product, partial [Amoebophrya sp. A120]|eukprot:GSA120T00003959001.1